MERNPEEVSSEQLVEYLDEYYSGCHVSKVRLRQDVRELIGCLLERGFVRVLEGKGDSAKFKIKDDVFRTDSGEVVESEDEVAVASESVYKAAESHQVGRIRGIADTWLGLVGILVYELVVWVGGFGVLCRIVESWPLERSKIWEFARVRQVCAGVERARIWYPKKVQCLQRSAVLSCLLRREGVPARMVIAGTRKPFYAHAWTEVEGIVVNDAQVVRSRYNIFRRCVGAV